MFNLDKLKSFTAKKDWLKISSIDMHTGGEPLRIITDGFPQLIGHSVLEKRKYMKENYDHLRTALMWEPRGHADQYGAVITEPFSKDADFGVFFIHNEGYSTMCGHAMIALTKIAVESGLVEMKEPETMIKIDAPAGLITSFAKCSNGKVDSVYFHNVPSFVYKKDLELEIESIGKIKFDIAYGGAFYVFVDAEQAGLKMIAEDYNNLIAKGKIIKKAVMDNFEIKHPFEDDLSFLYGVIFTGKPISKDADSRNVCIFADGEFDRSPTGSGVSARMAIHYDRGDIEIGDKMIIESILGSKFICSVKETVDFGGYKSVIPQVEGNADYTGKNEFWINPEDELKDGFIFR